MIEFFQANLGLILKIVFVLIVGIIAGLLIKGIIIKIGDWTGISKRVDQGRVSLTLKEAGYRGSFVRLVGSLFQWFVYLATLMIILKLLGFIETYEFLSQIIYFIPKAVVALVLVIVGWIFSGFLARLVYELFAKRTEIEQSRVVNIVISKITQIITAFIFIVMAFQVLGIEATTLLIILTILLVTIAIIFVLGIKETLPNFVAGLQLGGLGLSTGKMISFDNIKGKIVKMDNNTVTIETKSEIVIVENKRLISKEIKFPKK